MKVKLTAREINLVQSTIKAVEGFDSFDSEFKKELSELSSKIDVHNMNKQKHYKVIKSHSITDLSIQIDNLVGNEYELLGSVQVVGCMNTDTNLFDREYVATLVR